MSNMAKELYDNIDGIYRKVLNDLNQKNKDNPNSINVVVIYAHNGTGKTQLSKKFQEIQDNKVICYNAFFEDDFYWENNNSTFKIRENSWILQLIAEEGLHNIIVEKFKEFSGTKIEPSIDIYSGEISFKIPGNHNKIKISRGEESIFKWAVFYTLIEDANSLLNEEKDNRSTNRFDDVKYIFIDDPVSSMDDNRIITLALKISKLMVDSKNKFNFLITTHHPLFFSVLFHKRNGNWNKINYLFSKKENMLSLRKQNNESPFAYHHTAIFEIQDAIRNNDLKKYHFNLFRTLLEKTANFMGNNDWKVCLKGITENEDFLKIIDHYSHDKLSELEFSKILDSQSETFKIVFNEFLLKYNFEEAEQYD